MFSAIINYLSLVLLSIIQREGGKKKLFGRHQSRLNIKTDGTVPALCFRTSSHVE